MSSSSDHQKRTRLEEGVSKAKGLLTEALDELNALSVPPRAECPKVWESHLKEVLFPSNQIQDRVRQLAVQISKDYHGKEVVVVGLLTGAICFIVDLVRHLDVPYTMDFMALSSYRGTKSKGTVELKKDLSFDPAGKHILVVEDIVDTGGTLMWLRTYLKTKQCASVKVVCLLDKTEGRSVDNHNVIVDYVGFVCPNKFVIGYGLDYQQKYRGLPFIGVLKPEVYENASSEE